MSPFTTRWQSERERIAELGGIVSEIGGVFRLNGQLAVTRSFGDAKYAARAPPAPAARVIVG